MMNIHLSFDFPFIVNLISRISNPTSALLCSLQVPSDIGLIIFWQEHGMRQIFFEISFLSDQKFTYKKSNKNKMQNGQPVKQ